MDPGAVALNPQGEWNTGNIQTILNACQSPELTFSKFEAAERVFSWKLRGVANVLGRPGRGQTSIVLFLKAELLWE